MILLDSIVHSAINPALALLPQRMDSDAARVMLLAAGLQESRFLYRAQKTKNSYVKGPARGFWQFERGGGVVGVMTHRMSRELAKQACETAMRTTLAIDDDVLAAAFARLLLWTDPKPLPALNATHDEAWDQYMRQWRPGKPHRETWDEFHDQARAQVLSP
jgi:hypothetical protein